MIDINHPHPQFARCEYVSLNGSWKFAFDEEKNGEKKNYPQGFQSVLNIEVPYSYNFEKSGINDSRQIDALWYQREILLTEGDLAKDLYLHFEGVDYLCKSWLNGQYLGMHEGGYSSFAFLLNGAAKAGKNLLVVEAIDDFSVDHPRGKQRWENENFGCWYRQNNGIYRTVWLEKTPHLHLSKAKITPLYSQEEVAIDYEIANYAPGCEFQIILSMAGKEVNSFSLCPAYATGKIIIPIESPLFTYQFGSWHPFQPDLYELDFILTKGESKDVVHSYFGNREFKVREKGLYLNGFSFYLKYLLYQGYWEKTGLSMPSLEAAKKDILQIKSMGFNGIRLHQFIADEQFLALCDTLGLSVWCELPSAREFNAFGAEKVRHDWLAILEQKYNHPCVFAWVCENESWGVQEIMDNSEQQKFVDSLVAEAHAYDLTRPVISNDGWDHTESDIVTVHNYEQNAELLSRYFADASRLLQGEANETSMRKVFADGYRYRGQPMVISEFGGCAFENDVKMGWGYGKAVAGLNGFYARFASLVNAVYSCPNFNGFCYTQYNDIMQEKNGLVFENHELKVDPEKIKEILDKKA